MNRGKSASALRLLAAAVAAAAVCLSGQPPKVYGQTQTSTVSPTATTVEEVNAPSPDLKQITILMLNDVYNASPVDKGTRGGLARAMTLKKDIMSRHPDTLFLFAGDTISPSVASRTFKGKQMIEAWNALGIDYATLGNHEFDFGPEVLKQRIADSKFKWICANVIDKTTGKIFDNLDPYVIREVGGIKVGIIGLITPETGQNPSPGPDIEFLDPSSVARKYVPEMKQRGAQVIVALTHLPMSQDKDVAHVVPIDVTVGGHEHILMQSVAAGDAILKAGSDARNLGRITVNFSPAQNCVRSVDFETLPITDKVADDPTVAAVVEEYEGKLRAELDRQIATTVVPLDAMQIDNESQETNLGDFVCDSYRADNGAECCLINGGSIRSNQIYPPGKLTRRDVLSILPFENPIVKMQVTGATIKQALEQGVGEVGVRLSGRFPQVSGITFSYDASKPRNSRVSDVKINGKPLDANRMYNLATNNFLAEGGDGYLMLRGQKMLVNAQEGNAESVALLNYIQKFKSIAPTLDGRIKRLDTHGQ